MPNDKKTILETFEDSPYKKFSLAFMVNHSISQAMGICRMLDRINNIPTEINGKTNPASWENKILEVGGSFSKYHQSTDEEAEFRYNTNETKKHARFFTNRDTTALDKKTSDFFSELSEEFKKTCEKNAGNESFMAFKGTMDAFMLYVDYDKGDFLRAMSDNPYLYHLNSQLPGAPNISDRDLNELYEKLAKEPEKAKEPGKENEPEEEVKKTEPLGMIDDYFKCYFELFNREYEKQKMVDNGYTPEQEKKYLDDLKRDMKATLDNFDKLSDFVKQHPDEYKQGKYLGSDLDHITGVDPKYTRTSGYGIGIIRGQLGAIENGWGMEELSPFGAIGELKTNLENTAKRYDLHLKNCEIHIESDKKNIENEKDEKRKNRLQATYENHLRELETIKAKNEQSIALMNDLKELDETVINKKVTTAADKAMVLNTLSKFMDEKGKEYPLTDIDRIFKKEQKALINDSVDKVNNDLREKIPRVQANIKEKTKLPTSVAEMHKGTEYESCATYYYSRDLVSNSNMFTAMLDRENQKAGKKVESWHDKSDNVGADIQTLKQQVNNEKKFKYKYLDDFSKPNLELVPDPIEEDGIDPKDFDKELVEYANGVTEQYKEFCEKNKNNRDFQAVKNILDVTMLSSDLSKGSIFKAEMENPYLRILKLANNAIPNFNSVPLSEIRQALDGPVDPVTKKDTKPLPLMNDYFGGVYDLYMLEYEKQGMTKEDRTPEKEKDYLGRLKTTMETMINTFEKMKEFSREHPGEFKIGKYLPNDFDHTTGIDVEHSRHSGFGIGQLKGHVRAIENGWGMDELVHLGTLGELQSRLEDNVYRCSLKIADDQKGIEYYKKKLENTKDENERKDIENQIQGCEIRLKEDIPKKTESAALLKDMSELDEVMNKKVKTPADKMEAIIKISEFVEKNAKKYPNTKMDAVFNTEMKTLLDDSREKVFGQLQMDDAIKALEDGRKGTWFGKKDYDNVLRDMKALNEMYKANKEAVFAGDKAAVTPEIKAKEQEILAGMAAYKSRKEDEFAKNAAAGKQDNTNSRRRYNAMDKAMNDLLARIEFNDRLEKGFPPKIEAPQEEVVLIPDEPQVKEQLNTDAAQAKASEAAAPKKAEVPKAEEPEAEAIKSEAPKAEAPKGRPVINEETERYLSALKAQATSARGLIRDSDEYLGFLASIDKVTEVTRSINQSRKNNMILDEDIAYKRYAEAVHEMQTRAKDYEDYKLSDHTENSKADTKMKKLNSTDKEKLNIVRSVMHNNRHFNIGEPIVSLTDRRLSEAQEKIRAAKNGLKEQQSDFKKTETELDIKQEALYRKSQDIRLQKSDFELEKVQESLRKQRLEMEAQRKREHAKLREGLFAKRKGPMTGKASDEMKELRNADHWMNSAINSAEGNLKDPKAEAAMMAAYKASLNYELLKRKNDAGASWTPGTDMGKQRMESARAMREYIASKRPDLAEKAGNEFLNDNKDHKYANALNAVVNYTKPFIKAAYEQKKDETEPLRQAEFEARREKIAQARSRIEEGLITCERVKAQMSGQTLELKPEKKAEFDKKQNELDKQKNELLRKQGELELRPDADLPEINVQTVQNEPENVKEEPEKEQPAMQQDGIKNAENIGDLENAVIINNEVVEKVPGKKENEVGDIDLDHVVIVDDETGEVIEEIGGDKKPEEIEPEKKMSLYSRRHRNRISKKPNLK